MEAKKCAIWHGIVHIYSESDRYLVFFIPFFCRNIIVVSQEHLTGQHVLYDDLFLILFQLVKVANQ